MHREKKFLQDFILLYMLQNCNIDNDILKATIFNLIIGYYCKINYIFLQYSSIMCKPL